MKKKRLLSVFLFLMLFMVFPVFGVHDVSAQMTMNGWEYDEEMYEFHKHLDEQVVKVKTHNDGTIGLVTTTYSMFKRINAQDLKSDEVGYLYCYRSDIEPREYTYYTKFLWWRIKNTFHGYIEEVDYDVHLWQWTNYPYATKQELKDWTTVTEKVENKYTIGIGASTDGTFGFSASTEIVPKTCKITGNSSVYDDKYKANYNYVLPYFYFNGADYLYDSSHHYGVFTTVAKKGVVPYIYLHTTATFGYATGRTTDPNLIMYATGYDSSSRY